MLASILKPEEREIVVDSGASTQIISTKDLSNAEIDTLTKSCSPTIVITANGEEQTHEEAIVYVKELEKFLTMKVIENTTAVLSLRKLFDVHGYSYEWINGQKPHLINNGIRIPCNTENFVPIVVPVLSSSSSGSSSTSKTPSRQESRSSSSSSTSSSSPTVSEIQTGEEEALTQSDIFPVIVSPDDNQANKTPKPKTNKKESKREQSDQLCSETPEWLQEFRENLVDDEIPLQGGFHACSSHEASSEPTTKRREDLGSTVLILISIKTEIARSVNGPRLQGPLTEDAMAKPYFVLKNFGDVITGDPKVLSDNCESRNNHRYAVVVQNIATQWIQAYPCKTKLHKKPREA